MPEGFHGAAEFKIFATGGSGERLDRQELIDIQREVDSRRYDLVLMEDLGRYLRGLEAMHFCGTCVDAGTRLIAINDHIDTERQGWDDNALFAAWRHKRYNEDTSRRIKQRLGNRFEHEGGVFQSIGSTRTALRLVRIAVRRSGPARWSRASRSTLC